MSRGIYKRIIGVNCGFFKGKHHTEETIKKIKEKLKGRKSWNKGLPKEQQPKFGKKLSEKSKKIIGFKNSVNMKGKHNSFKTEFKKGLISWNKGKHYNFSEEIKKKMKERQIKLWKNQKYRQSQIEKILKGSIIKPNKPETFLSQFLNNLLLNEYKYVGDGQCIIGGKCPDFMNINGKKKLIELYGDYWHKGENEKDRIDYFKQYGFDTLIIWEKELKNQELLKDKILQFNA